MKEYYLAVPTGLYKTPYALLYNSFTSQDLGKVYDRILRIFHITEDGIFEMVVESAVRDYGTPYWKPIWVKVQFK